MIKFLIEPGYDVKAPERAFGNAGVDCFIPNYTETFEKAFNEKNLRTNAYLEKFADGVYIVIPEHGRANIPSGLRRRIEPNVALEAHNKSGIATKRGIIFGALNSESIAWKVAVKAVEEGAVITLSNTPMALRMGELDELSQQLNAPVIPADATSVEDLEKVFSESVD
jgi:dUTPase